MKRRWLGNSVSYIYLTILAAVATFPLLWIISSSFKSPGEMVGSPLSFFPKEPTLLYYDRVLNVLNFDVNIVNSIIVALSATFISIVISALAAYGIVRFFPRVGKVMTRVLITTYLFPPILLAIPYSILITKVQLANSLVGLVITYLSFSIPYAVWLMIGFFRTVPLEIEEAARVDGANKLMVFYRIALPVVAPGIVAVAVYTFINAWNEFLFSLILINSTGKMPVSVALYSLTGAEILDWGEMMAASVLVILPSVIFFLIIQNKIAGGLTQGSVK
ncbi:carbohydrate ABC transporter permease [Paenibacillus oenotherae]|uniref:Carbohydrate ABC transporter permease n=2 Tax=Paenibacillus oenotherae TaxID=1435645 RepID=A0ABS7D7E3_9BACL|nr:carbohydrate ABC transporter permease [Paenibacillus oenotherae]